MDQRILKIQETVSKELKNIYSVEKGVKNPLARLESNYQKSLRYAHMLYIVKSLSASFKSKKQKVYSEKWKQYKYGGNYALNTKADVEAFIFKDDDYIKVADDYEEIKLLIEFLELIVSVFRDREVSERILAKAKVDGFEYQY